MDWFNVEGRIMKDYSSYTMEELEEMSKAAFSAYYKLAIIPCAGQPEKPALNRLRKLGDEYGAICGEIEKRLGVVNQ